VNLLWLFISNFLISLQLYNLLEDSWIIENEKKKIVGNLRSDWQLKKDKTMGASIDFKLIMY
jgi:hypothetical protein